LALFGVVVSAGLAVLAWLAGQVFLAWVLIVLGVVAAVDVVVVQTRRRARRREEGNGGHSLFE
jgi:hypothetical protein